MEKSVTLLVDQLRGVRTGRANVGLVESVRVDYYGSPTPLKQMANLSTPEPQQILIRRSGTEESPHIYLMAKYRERIWVPGVALILHFTAASE